MNFACKLVSLEAPALVELGSYKAGTTVYGVFTPVFADLH